MKRYSALLFTILVGALALAVTGWGQESPFVDEQTFQILDNHLSGDRAKDNLAILTRFHRPGGTPGFHQAAEFVLKKGKEYGLEGIHLIRQKSRGASWRPGPSQLWMLEPERVKLADNTEVALHLADYSRPADVTAELVDVGSGTEDAEYADRDVKGKIVLAYGPPSAVMRKAVWEHGALGIVSYYSSRANPLADHPDQLAWTRVPSRPGPKDQEPTFAFVVSPRTGLWLKSLLSGKDEHRRWGGPPVETRHKVVLRAHVESSFDKEPWMEMIEYVLPGREIHDQDIVLTAHLQEEKFSANDDGSGSMNLLEIARALTTLVKSGVLPRPRRDIRFWWTTEIASEYRYFADHPEERDQMLVDINQDMVGAVLEGENRVQHITRTPYSLPSYLSDVVQSIAEMVILGNNAFLATRQAGKTQRGTHYSRPILSHLGRRTRFAAMVVPYFDNTDHLVFCDSIIGIPGVTLTNWPDEYIHSSDDGLWNVDATTLKRNAFIVAAAALYLANASDAEVPRILAEVYGRGRARIDTDGRTALQLLVAAPAEQRLDVYKRARNLVHQAVLREQKAVRSVRVFARPNGANMKLIERFAHDMENLERDWRARLDRMYRTLTGHAPPRRLPLSKAERAAARKVPHKVGTIAEYLEKSRKIRPVRGLHAILRFEILNFVDGRNSVLDIYHAIDAEALSVGSFYYGTVTLEQVEKLLENAVKAGVIEMAEG